MDALRKLEVADCESLVDAFCGADAQQAWDNGMAALANLGIVPATQNEPAWHEVVVGENRVALSSNRDWDASSGHFIQKLVTQALHRLEEARTSQRLEERLQMLSNASFEGILFHAEGTVIDANHRIAELLRCDYDEVFVDWTRRNVIAPEDVPTVQRNVMSGYEGTYVVTVIRKDGTKFRAELQSKQGRYGERPVRVIAVRDVTERERVEGLLRESEGRLRDLVDTAFDMTVFSRDGIVVDIGGPLIKRLGYEVDEMIGRPILDFVAPSRIPKTRKVLAQEKHGAIRNTVVARDGTPIPVEVVAVTSTLHGQPTRVSGLRDLSETVSREQERHRLQQQLERAQRLDSLGVLAGGVAHDFNNLLVGIIGNADLLLDGCEDPQSREELEAILAAGKQAASLTARLLAYAGRSNELAARRPIELGKLAGHLQVLLSASLSKKARLEIDVADDCVVMGDSTSLTQVLMNLLTNASDALAGEPGWIRIRGRLLTEIGAEWDDALGATITPGRWVLLQVHDSGKGMDEEALSRAFEPFYTTKEGGHGLGLAACIGIVRTLGGALRVESTLGEGSVFSLLLPATQEAAEQPAVSNASSPAPCRVLLADDEPVVRGQMRRVLELRGFAVVEAADGLSALSQLERDQFDLMVLDLTMPEMDGAEVATEVRKRGYDLPIVMTSGYFTADIEQRLDPAAFQAVLSKPYVVSELMEAIERARAAPRPSVGS